MNRWLRQYHDTSDKWLIEYIEYDIAVSFCYIIFKYIEINWAKVTICCLSLESYPEAILDWLAFRGDQEDWDRVSWTKVIPAKWHGFVEQSCHTRS